MAALPTLVKTWQHNVNNPQAAQGTGIACNRLVWRNMKNALLGFALSAWTVRYSCGNAVAGVAGDGVDRWVVDTDLVWNTAPSNHSWIVLRNPSTGWELLLSCETAAASGSSMYYAVSPSAGFTGGTAGNRPTATDEMTVQSGINTGTDRAIRWSVSMSTDGQCLRLWTASAGSVNNFFFLDKPANVVTGWTNPVCLWATNVTPTITSLTGYTNGKLRIGTTNGAFALGCETAGQSFIPNDTVIGMIANEVDGTWPILPIGIACSTVGIRGRHATMVDMWMGSVSIPSADTYPADATNQFINLTPGLILPWNGGPVNLV